MKLPIWMSSKFVGDHGYEIEQASRSSDTKITNLSFFYYYFSFIFLNFLEFFGIFSYLKILKIPRQSESTAFDLVNRSNSPQRGSTVNKVDRVAGQTREPRVWILAKHADPSGLKQRCSTVHILPFFSFFLDFFHFFFFLSFRKRNRSFSL